MRTPGRCTNHEGCWISSSQRNMWLSIGQDFVCPNCGGNLGPPPAQTSSFRGLKRASAMAVMAGQGLLALFAGAQKLSTKLSTMSWPGQSVAARVARVPASLTGGSSLHPPASSTRPVQEADAPARAKPSTTSTEGMALAVVAARPTSPLGQQGISASNARAQARRTTAMLRMAADNTRPVGTPDGPLVLYKAAITRSPRP